MKPAARRRSNMNISYNWLKDLIDLPYPAEETAESLTRVGLAVEGIHPFKDDFVLDIDLTSAAVGIA